MNGMNVIGLCVLLGMAEILDVEMPQALHLLRRMQAFMQKEYVSELPDVRVSRS